VQNIADTNETIIMSHLFQSVVKKKRYLKQYYLCAGEQRAMLWTHMNYFINPNARLNLCMQGVFKKNPTFLNSAPTITESALRLLSAPSGRF
jgi:hypothetical protein